MGDRSLGTPPSERTLDDRLDSWKEIATYLNRDVTTVQRWEKREGMPVHRHQHDRMGSVYASRAELDAWTQSRNLPPTQENGNGVAPSPPPVPPPAPVTPSPTKWKVPLLFGLVAAALVAGAGFWLYRTEYFWRNPLTDAHFQPVTDFGGFEQSAAVSRDGRLIAFLSDRDGQMDIWITQAGSGQFHNLTRGGARGIVNPSIRTLGFSPDGSAVTFWIRKQDGPSVGNIGVWAVPTLGGEPRPYLEGVAEYDWSPDGGRLAYHTPGPGDPLFVSDGTVRPGDRPLFTAPAGLHSHFPLWSRDTKSLYFVQGELPDKLDLWRIPATGGVPERITHHNARVSHPVLLDGRTLLYLASDADGSGPFLYSMDVERRIPHRLTSGLDRYTSLAASADGRRLLLSIANPKTTLWRLQMNDSPAEVSAPTPIPLTTSTGFSPGLGPNYLLYLSRSGTGENIWKLANGTSTQLWSGQGVKVIGGPSSSPNGHDVTFSVSQHGQTLLYAMHSDGTNARVVADSLKLNGAPTWAPDGLSIITAADDHGVPHLVRVPLDGRSPTSFVREYSVDPVSAPDGSFIVYSGPDIGTTFFVKAVTAEGAPYTLPPVKLTRGARHLAFLSGGRSLVVLRGETQHENLWVIDRQTGIERQLTNLPPDFEISDFDISPDGHEVVLERVQDRSDIVMLDLVRP
jgi:Tol biopolymer transport system component